MDNKLTSIPHDSTVRSQDSNDSKGSSNADSKTESCLESKHSKDGLISETTLNQQTTENLHRIEGPKKLPPEFQDQSKDLTSLLMFLSCGQLLLGVVLVVFGILVLVHGAALSGSGAGLWSGTGALVAGALGVVATLAMSSTKPDTGFSSAHLASSLVALALTNMSAITALTAVVRDSQKTQQVTLLDVSGEVNHVVEIESIWSSILASVGLLVASVAELLVSGYTCVTLTPKLCGCLKSDQTDDACDGRLKTRNMVHQWVIAQNHHVPKNQPFYVVQPMVPMHHALIQSPYGIPATTSGKFPGGFVTTPGTVPIAASTPYGHIQMLPHMPYTTRPPSQMIRAKHNKRHQMVEPNDTIERKRHAEGKIDTSSKRMSSIGEDQVDLSLTYTGLDKKISEEFIAIAMDPDRKSRASSNNGSEIGPKKVSC